MSSKNISWSPQNCCIQCFYISLFLPSKWGIYIHGLCRALISYISTTYICIVLYNLEDGFILLVPHDNYIKQKVPREKKVKWGKEKITKCMSTKLRVSKWWRITFLRKTNKQTKRRLLCFLLSKPGYFFPCFFFFCDSILLNPFLTWFYKLQWKNSDSKSARLNLLFPTSNEMKYDGLKIDMIKMSQT